jgi:adenine/guanine phosphoribosyltransferase-like PRPP-binding protein
MHIDAIAGIESRGFLFGLTLATKAGRAIYTGA